jgi:UDPglucose 6-dehydrogenase
MTDIGAAGLLPADDAVVAVIGGGYVGLVTAVCLAEMGRTVRVVEADATRLNVLRSGHVPIHEPGLDDLLREVTAAGRFAATDDMRSAVDGAGIIFLAVGTPPRPDGNADLSQVRAAVAQIGEHAADGSVLAIKSTVPPGTTGAITVPRAPNRGRIPVVSCPEFLREGDALKDFRAPARVVIGGIDKDACARVAALFEPLGTPLLVMDATSAELVKYGANAFLALKISFINEIARICELTGGDIEAVADGVGRDPRIGSAFLRAGLGFGGSCFPKDVRALDETASYHGHSFWLLKAAMEVNRLQRTRFVGRIREAANPAGVPPHVAILGLAFKPGTDDMRQAASIDVIRQLEDAGCTVAATDPVAVEVATPLLQSTRITTDPYDCVVGADVVALVTEWPEYGDLDWNRVAQLVRHPAVVDGRNYLDPAALRAAGFSYMGIGRPLESR